jgi:hypothetical protein
MARVLLSLCSYEGGGGGGRSAALSGGSPAAGREGRGVGGSASGMPARVKSATNPSSTLSEALGRSGSCAQPPSPALSSPLSLLLSLPLSSFPSAAPPCASSPLGCVSASQSLQRACQRSNARTGTGHPALAQSLCSFERSFFAAASRASSIHGAARPQSPSRCQQRTVSSHTACDALRARMRRGCGRCGGPPGRRGGGHRRCPGAGAEAEPRDPGSAGLSHAAPISLMRCRWVLRRRGGISAARSAGRGSRRILRQTPA